MEISRFAILPLLANISVENFLLEGFERRINDGYKVTEVFTKLVLSLPLNDLFENVCESLCFACNRCGALLCS